MSKREEIVAEALTWVGTPFHANQRLKGVGADCIGVASGIAEACGYSFPYRNDYSMRPDGTLRGELAARLERVNGAPLPGDVLLMAFDREPHHVAVYVGNNEIVHSYAQARRCVRGEYNDYWRAATRGVFRLPGIDA